MSDVERFIKQKNITSPGFEQLVEKELNRLLLGEEIRRMRKAMNMTQEELAKRSGTTKNVIYCLENHSENVKLEILEKVARVFDKQVVITLK